MEIHLDLIGGLAGDMFIAALLDAQPQHEIKVKEAIEATRGSKSMICGLRAHRDHVQSGSRFEVVGGASEDGGIGSRTAVQHDHLSWQAIRSRLVNAALPEAVRQHAIQIFELLAEAEGWVHGVAAEAVEFHEVGAWDSIADIVGAATLIDALGVTRCTSSAVPLGSGRVATAHGLLPVPAPATARLLLGMPTLDDGVAGERVTPTGAAILRHLVPPAKAPLCRPGPRTLIASGTGFGARRLAGLSNHVRVLCFEPVGEPAAGLRVLQVIEFEVDDQSGEDLSVGLDRLRTQAGVLDVTQTPVFGKKGRMGVHVRILAQPQRLDEIVSACFEETTTIGLRHHRVDGIFLKRTLELASVGGHSLRVKRVERLSEVTAKAESDDVLCHSHHAQRAALRRRAEASVLAGYGDEAGA